MRITSTGLGGLAMDDAARAAFRASVFVDDDLTVQSFFDGGASRAASMLLAISVNRAD